MKKFFLSSLACFAFLLAVAVTPVESLHASITQSNDYTPREVVVCELKSTTAKICWKTTSPSNSEIVYVKATETLNPDKSPPNQKGSTFTNTDNHFLNLTGLTADTKYKYVVRSSPNAQTTATKSTEYVFTTTKADGTGGDKGTLPGKADGSVDVSKFSWDGNLNITDPTGDGQIGPVLTKIINWLLLVIAMVAVLVMIYGGLMMIFNAGNEARITQAKSTLIWAIIGLAVALGSFALVNLIEGILG